MVRDCVKNLKGTLRNDLDLAGAVVGNRQINTSLWANRILDVDGPFGLQALHLGEDQAGNRNCDQAGNHPADHRDRHRLACPE